MASKYLDTFGKFNIRTNSQNRMIMAANTNPRTFMFGILGLLRLINASFVYPGVRVEASVVR